MRLDGFASSRPFAETDMTQAADRYKAGMAKRKAIGDAEVAPTP
jgi:hypothetical protein